MKITSLVFVLLTLAAAQAPAPREVPVAQEPSHHLVLENQYMRTYLVEVPPGKATLLHRHDNDYVFVVLGDAHISNEVFGQPPREQQVKDGDVNFAPGGFAHVARNLGPAPFRNVTIEVLRKSTSSEGMESSVGRVNGRPVTREQTVVATDAVTVTKLEIAPGANLARHRHDRDHMGVAVSALHLKNDVMGKGTSRIEQKPGDVVWIKGGFEHTLTNVGKAPARFVAVEFH